MGIQYNIKKACIFSAVELHMNQNDICMLGMQNTRCQKKKKRIKLIFSSVFEVVTYKNGKKHVNYFIWGNEKILPETCSHYKCF